jgi:MYXO-CTERM domain-containing protein
MKGSLVVMKQMSKWAGVVLLLVLSTRAGAVQVELSAGGNAASTPNRTVNLSNGLTADVVLNGKGLSLNLTPGVEQTVTLNDVDFDTILASTATGSDTVSQTLSVTSPAASPSSFNLVQNVSINISLDIFSPPAASVTLGGASPVTFDLAGGAYKLKVTPLGGSDPNFTETPTSFSNQASFLLTEVPEPAGAGVAALLAAALMRRRRSTKQI